MPAARPAGDHLPLNFIFLIIALLLTVAGCASRGGVQAPSATAVKLVSYAQSLTGTRYAYGGNSPQRGFDCSGFVDHVFLHETGIRLPRSTLEISHRGGAVSGSELHPGDLVFFNTLHTRFSHVGIYLRDGDFIHAPSSGGKVRVDSMHDDYWRRRYNGARRIIPDR